MPGQLDPDFPLFLGGMLAAICLFVAALIYLVALPGSSILVLSYAFGALGAVFLGVGVLAAVGVWAYRRR